ncbi:unnamed protein product, partial [Urochloa humidicola]
PHLSSLAGGVPGPCRAPLGCASGGASHGDPRMVGEAAAAMTADAHGASLFWPLPPNIPTTTYLTPANQASLQW